MSVQNGERLATKQDLKDMYQGILPYLGGMPEVLANKFSKGDLYSTEERLIGQWIDSKPLYQKSVEYTLTQGINKSDFTIPVTLTDLETVANVHGTLYSGATICLPLASSAASVSQGNALGIISIGVISDSSIQIRCPNQTLQVGDKVYVTLQYTKTTDSAISIGDETDYSTTEKIVGTWIDSKPIYQKTYVLNNEEGFANNAWTYLSITEMTPIENIISLSAFQSNGTNVSFDIWYDASSHKFSVKSLRTENEYVKVFTIQYTKSS